MSKLFMFAMVISCLISCTSLDDTLKDQIISQTQSFVGQITGADTLVAFHLKGNLVTGYTCGGDQTWEEHTAWFSGEIDKDKNITIKSNDGRIIRGSLSGHITAPPQSIIAPPQAITAPPQALLPLLGFAILNDSNGSGQGELTFPDGKSVNWSVEVPDIPSAGLYRYENEEFIIGVIVHNDGRVFGAASSKKTKKIVGQTMVIKPIDKKRCLEVKVNGQTFSVEPLGESGPCH